MIKVSDEIKAEFVKDVDTSINKCVIEIYNALTKMLIKACPEKAEELKDNSNIIFTFRHKLLFKHMQ